MAHYLPTDTPPKELKIEASYRDWGRKGLTVQFTVVTREKRLSGMTSESFELAGKGNFSVFVLPLTRRNAKKLAAFDAYVGQQLPRLDEAYRADDRAAIERILGGFGA